MIFLRPFLPHIAGALLAALLVAGIGWRISAGRADTLKGERDKARAEIVQLLAAVEGKDDTITALQAAVAKWQSLSTPAAAMAEAAARVESAAERIEARSAGLTASEVKDRANPDCAAILAMDLARACPAIAAGVRQRAAGAGLPR